MGRKKIFLKVLFVIITILIQSLITYFISAQFGFRFLDTMFFTSIGFIAISFLFSSSGGIVSDMANMKASKELFSAKVVKPQPFSLRINSFVISSILFFICFWMMEIFTLMAQ